MNKSTFLFSLIETLFDVICGGNFERLNEYSDQELKPYLPWLLKICFNWEPIFSNENIVIDELNFEQQHIWNRICSMNNISKLMGYCQVDYSRVLSDLMEDVRTKQKQREFGLVKPFK